MSVMLLNAVEGCLRAGTTARPPRSFTNLISFSMCMRSSSLWR